MNQVKNVLSSLFEPLTKIETYENLAIKIALIIIYIIVALIVIAILNKGFCCKVKNIANH
ncbi:hypothetical protein BDW31_1111 [Staphylococcus sp. AtHG25]|nr:hypothetical protein BDW31_1111 [Staphylococcus sp. AtHG25]